MLGHSRRQLDFTDLMVIKCWQGRPLVPDESFYSLLAKTDDIFRDELFAEAYATTGRPCVPPSRLIKVLLLQLHDNVSDREAENRARYDLRWKVALGIGLGESGFDYSVLSYFRTRLLLSRKERAVFEEILRQAANKGLLPSRDVVQILDSTHMLGAGAVQDTYTLVRLAIRRLLGKLGERLESVLSEPLKLDYRTRSKPKINWQDRNEREALLNDLVGDARKILVASKDFELSAEEQELREILARVSTQDIVCRDDGSVTLQHGVAQDRIISIADPQMRHGRKSAAHKFDGYKAHTAMERESEMITDVEITPGNVHDSEVTSTLLVNSVVKTDTIIADTAYGTGQNRVDLAEREIKIIAPTPTEGYRPGYLRKSQFQIDMEAETCQCPAGQWASEKLYSRSKILKGFGFSREQCQGCPLRTQCFQNKHGRRTIVLHRHEGQLQEARRFQETPEFEEIYRQRANVERKQAEMVRNGLRQARYFGLAKARLQALLVASVINFRRYCQLLSTSASPGVNCAPVPA